MLFEWRRNPESNPKISIYDILRIYYDLDIKNDESKYFIHLTGEIKNYNKNKKNIVQRTPNLPKIGINPNQNYKTTPFGIYAYPLKDSWTFYHIETNKNLEDITFPVAEKDRKYVYVLKTKSSINLINVETYTKEQLERDKKLLNEFYDYDFSEEFEKPIFRNFIKEHLNFPYFKLKNITYNIAKKHSKNKIILTWTSIFRKLGYDGIYDPGIGLIDPSEECQCVFFKKDVIENVALFHNKDYTIKEIYKFNDKVFTGIKRNGVLYFKHLDISIMNIKSLKELPWSNKPYSVSISFNCSSNLLKDLEGGPIYAEDYNCSNNLLETLKGVPDKVKYFNCSYNETLKTLEGAPKSVEDFLCNDCSIQSLQYISDNVAKLNCSNNRITSLKYLPKTVKNLDCSSNQLIDLEYSTDDISYFNCSYNKTLKTLEGAPKICKEFYCIGCGLNDLKGVPKTLYYIDFSENDVKSLKDLDECVGLRCHLNLNLKLDFKPKNLIEIEGVDGRRKVLFLKYNRLET